MLIEDHLFNAEEMSDILAFLYTTFTKLISRKGFFSALCLFFNFKSLISWLIRWYPFCVPSWTSIG